MAMGLILNPEQVNCTKWTLMYYVEHSGAEHYFSRPKVKGDLLWGGFEAWVSITWTVLSGLDAVLVGRWLWGNLEA